MRLPVERGAKLVFDDFQGRGQYDVIVTYVAMSDSSFALDERPLLIDLLEADRRSREDPG